MKIKNGMIMEIINTLNKFSDQSGIIGFAIAKNLRILKDESQEFDKIRRDLIFKYGKEDSDGNHFIDTNDKDSYEAFLREYAPVANYVVDVNLYQIDRSQYDIPYAETATAKDYEMLEVIIVNEEV